jgi:ketosteroid isomerase-like protein
VEVGEWAERYARAWEHGDEDAVAALFTEDAEYRSAPFRDAFRGEARRLAARRRPSA